MVIDHEILLGAQQRIDNALQEELQITAPRDSSKDAKAPRCASGIEAAYVRPWWDFEHDGRSVLYIVWILP